MRNAKRSLNCKFHSGIQLTLKDVSNSTRINESPHAVSTASYPDSWDRSIDCAPQSSYHLGIGNATIPQIDNMRSFFCPSLGLKEPPPTAQMKESEYRIRMMKRRRTGTWSIIFWDRDFYGLELVLPSGSPFCNRVACSRAKIYKYKLGYFLSCPNKSLRFYLQGTFFDICCHF